MFISPRLSLVIAISAALYLSNIPFLALSEEVYKMVNEQGVTEYSDKKPLNDPISEIVTLKIPNVLPAITRPSTTIPYELPNTLQRTVEIAAPDNQRVIPMGPGNFIVSVSVAPKLTSGEQLQLIMNNKPLRPPQKLTNWSLKNIPRGRHTLQVTRQHLSGEIIHKSSKIQILVLRPLPARR